MLPMFRVMLPKLGSKKKDRTNNEVGVRTRCVQRQTVSPPKTSANMGEIHVEAKPRPCCSISKAKTWLLMFDLKASAELGLFLREAPGQSLGPRALGSSTAWRRYGLRAAELSGAGPGKMRRIEHQPGVTKGWCLVPK